MDKLISFEKFKGLPVTNKPAAVSNQSFPYQLLANPRRFEELLYSIFELKIKNGEICNFDDVNLMTGVRDQGRDCALMRNGECYGLIQCKKYEQNYGKNDFGSEIVRFALYSLTDSRLIAEPGYFIYYIAVSKGFTDECGKFIDDFSANILSEPQFESWVNISLELPTLKHLKSSLDLANFKSLVSGLTVKKILPQDLDIALASPSCSSLIPLFFEVRTVTDNSQIETLINHLEKHFTADELLSQLKIGSARLQSERNTFRHIENSHVERVETEQLYNWVLEAPEKKNGVVHNICLLAGEAGYGKTVVLKDLYSKCLSNNVVVLGLKADKLYSNTIKALQESLGFALPVHDFIRECKKHFSRIVILIDQIDALSQSMSSDRSYLEFYRAFIDYYANDENTRFIISVRTSDLQYDPSLKIYKDTKTIKLGLLGRELVLELLNKISIDGAELPPKLLELLRVPNHLNIFSQLASSLSVLRASNLLELYYELWRQKVTEIGRALPTNRGKIKELLYTIAKQMFRDQKITVSAFQYEDHSEEIRYLESEQLIKVEDRQLQFFHQSFYDFVFAKQFVEANESLIDYIKNGEQSIHIRSAVKMIISYMRESDPVRYIRTLNDLFFNDEILFHIRHILMVILAGQESPIDEEKEFVLKAFSYSFHWLPVFFEHAQSKLWLFFAIKHNLFEILEDDYQVSSADGNHIQPLHLNKTKSFLVGFLARFVLQQNDANGWEALRRIKNETVVQNMLVSVTDWSNPLSYQLFESMPNFVVENGFGYYRVLDNIAKVNPLYVLTKLDEILPLHFERSPQIDYRESQVLRTLAKTDPQMLFPILYNAMKSEFGSDSEPWHLDVGDFIIKNHAYSYTDLRDTEDLHGSDFLYQLLGICLKRSARNYKQAFLAFFNEHKQSRYQIILRLLLFALEGSEESYSEQIFELFCIFKKRDLLSYGDDIEHDLRGLLEISFPFFTEKQKQFVIQTIRFYSNKKEIFYRKENGGEKSYLWSSWGLSKLYLIKRLPKEIIEREFRQEYQELQRRFSNTDTNDTHRKRSVTAGVVHSPISIEVCAKMSVKQWLRAFGKYDVDRDRWGKDFLKGGLHELARAFQGTVKQYPGSDKLQVIDEVLRSETIPLKYAIYGLWGWLEGEGDKSLIVSLVKKMLHRNAKEDSRIRISILAQMVGDQREEPEFIQALVDAALNFGEGSENAYQTEEGSETTINGLVAKAINTDYGAAIEALTRVEDPAFEDLVFETIEKVFKDGPRESRAAAFFKFAYLLNLNEEKAFRTFLNCLGREQDIYVIASSIWSFKYMRSRGFLELKPIYEKLIVSNLLGHDDAHMLFMSLYGSYLHGKNGAKEILFQLLEINSNIWGIALSEVLKSYYIVDNSKERNDGLLNFLLDKAIDANREDLNWNFIHADHLKLEDIYPFVKRFVKSKFFRLSDHFLDYLILQIIPAPYKSIELFELALKNKESRKDGHLAFGIEEKSVKFIVNSINGLNQNTNEARIARQKVLLMFDTLLQDYGYGTNSNKVLEELI